MTRKRRLVTYKCHLYAHDAAVSRIASRLLGRAPPLHRGRAQTLEKLGPANNGPKRAHSRTPAPPPKRIKMKKEHRMSDHEKQNKSERFAVRLTSKQLETLKAKARLSGLSASQFVVESAIEGRTSFALARIPGAPNKPEAEEVENESETQRFDQEEMTTFTMRLPLSVHRRLSELARRGDVSKAEYIRRLIRKEPIVLFDRDLFAQALGELNKQGGNLNQMTRKLNLLSAIASREDVDGATINQLINELQSENNRTRGSINAAAIAVRDLALDARRQLGQRRLGETDKDA